MSDRINEIILYISTIFLSILPLVKEFWPNLLKRAIYISLLVVIIIVMITTGLNKIGSDNHQKNLSDSTNNSLSLDLVTIRDKLTNDSIHNKRFEKSLEEKFNIIRDAKTNMPVKNTFNTYINKARDVNIGGK